MRLALMLATGLSAMANEPADPRLLPATEIRATEEGGWQLWVEGAPFTIKGAGGAEAEGLLEALREAGGNCVRTWGIETLDRVYANGETFIDRAHRLGIKVVPGIWVQHERHGFDYGDPAVIEQQRQRVIESVRAYR
ncbi:MAG: hypothetical protein KDM81_19825, partial [Verrucomicrobiae bacterium]|nr:hypothetical protein [Verrucomicrobiae bacterium]